METTRKPAADDGNAGDRVELQRWSFVLRQATVCSSAKWISDEDFCGLFSCDVRIDGICR